MGNLVEDWFESTGGERPGSPVTPPPEEEALWRGFHVPEHLRTAQPPVFAPDIVGWHLEHKGANSWLHYRREGGRLELRSLSDGGLGYRCDPFWGVFLCTNAPRGPQREFLIVRAEAWKRDIRGVEEASATVTSAWEGTVVMGVTGAAFESVASLRRQGFYLGRAARPGAALYPDGARPPSGFPYRPLEGLSAADLDAADWMAFTVAVPGPYGKHARGR